VHRTVFLTGVLAYASAPLWLAFLLVSTLLFATQAHDLPKYFVEPFQLFPIWPTANLRLMLTLFGMTAVLLLAPKALSLLIIMLRGEARRFGGVLRLAVGAVLEFVHSMLLAPVRMLFHTQFVLAALTGWKLEWKSPPRDGAATGWGEALRRHGTHTMLALLWIGAILVSSATFPWWLSPVLFGLLVAIPLSAWGSRAELGLWLRARRIFLIPEEVAQPKVLAEAERYAATFAPMPRVVDAVTDEISHLQVMRAIPARPAATGAKARAQARLIEDAAAGGPQALTKSKRLRLLADAQVLRAVRQRVFARQAHPDWWLPAAPPERRAATHQAARADAPLVKAAAAAQ
jgi:membrane glycosyltransferase